MGWSRLAAIGVNLTQRRRRLIPRAGRGGAPIARAPPAHPDAQRTAHLSRKFGPPGRGANRPKSRVIHPGERTWYRSLAMTLEKPGAPAKLGNYGVVVKLILLLGLSFGLQY